MKYCSFALSRHNRHLNYLMMETCSYVTSHHFLEKSDPAKRAAGHMMQTLPPCILQRKKKKTEQGSLVFFKNNTAAAIDFYVFFPSALSHDNLRFCASFGIILHLSKKEKKRLNNSSKNQGHTKHQIINQEDFLFSWVQKPKTTEPQTMSDDIFYTVTCTFIKYTQL